MRYKVLKGVFTMNNLVSVRDGKGKWSRYFEVKANSLTKARDIILSQNKWLGNSCETHRVKPGHTVYECDHGAICVKRIGDQL
jgi:hypothetical protein